MRNIFHEIFERYLNTERAEFDTTIRELWPTERFALRPQNSGTGSGTRRGRNPDRTADRGKL